MRTLFAASITMLLIEAVSATCQPVWNTIDVVEAANMNEYFGIISGDNGQPLVASFEPDGQVFWFDEASSAWTASTGIPSLYTSRLLPPEAYRVSSKLGIFIMYRLRSGFGVEQDTRSYWYRSSDSGRTFSEVRLSNQVFTLKSV